jgi:SAM-dependent methyltransferase
MQIKDEVRKHYAAIASQEKQSCCTSTSDTSCCSPQVNPLTDYGELVAILPEGADLGLGCGMPTKFAELQPGEIVLDLGSGAGIDVFLAARQVGASGRAIGVDMTPEMIARAWENAVKGKYTNVDFRLGEIEHLPVKDASINVILSNCVINLAPDKRPVFAEMYRVLQPGGRFIISDVVSFGNVPAEIRRDVELWAGCIAGALDRELYLALIDEAGFEQVQVVHSSTYDSGKGEDFGFASIIVSGRKGS